MVRITSTGLQSATAASTSLRSIQWAEGAGSADALTGAFTPAITSLYNGLIVGLRVDETNATSTPTLNVDSLGSHTIVKNFGDALDPGDIPDEGLFRYNATNSVWILLNPNAHFRVPTATWADAGGTADAITATFDPPIASLVDGMIVGVRASGANTVVAPTFSPNSLTARAIKKLGAQALVAGDIARVDHELLLRYHEDATPWWELLNPANASTGSALISAFQATDVAGSDTTSAQTWFSSTPAVTLPVGSYKFEGVLRTTRTAGTNAHVTKILFAHAATFGFIGYMAECVEGDANDLQDVSGISVAVATAVTVKASSTAAAETTTIAVKGILTVTVAGTVTPQFQYDAAPGGAPTRKAGTYIIFTPLATNPQGPWA